MKYLFGIALVVAVIMAGWEFLEPEVTNMIFQDELSDTAAQVGWRTGVTGPRSDEELRSLVILKAAKHDIVLAPKQVFVRRDGTPDYPTWYIAVDYTVKADLLLFSLPLHFTPTSKGGRFGGIGVSEPASSPSPAKPLPKPSQQRTDQPRNPQQPPELKEIPPSLKRPQ